MVAHSSILACRIPWTAEPGSPLGWQRAGHNWVTKHTTTQKGKKACQEEGVNGEKACEVAGPWGWCLGMEEDAGREESRKQTWVSLSMFQCYSLDSSHHLLPPLCPQVCSLCLRLPCCPAKRFISTIFLDSIYMLIYDICFSLSDFTLYNRF